MSVKVMGHVWELDLAPNKKYVLLAYADHADHAGNGIYPSEDLIAYKTGYSRRQVQRITDELTVAGLLIPDGVGPQGTNKFRYGWDAGPKQPPFEGKKGRQNVTPQDDKMSPPGVTSTTKGGDILTQNVSQMSPEPSVEPSIEPSFKSENPADENHHRIWRGALGQLEAQLGKAIYNTWLKDLKLVAVEDRIFVLAVRNQLALDYCEGQLYKSIRRLVRDCGGGMDADVRFEVKEVAHV